MSQALKRQEVDGPDMTPMLDIVFIMLIFFIVTASFVHEEGLQLGRSDNPPVNNMPEEDTLTFRLLADYRIESNGRLVDLWSAAAQIKEFHTEHPEQPIGIKLERGAKHRTMVRLIDVAYDAGLPTGRVVVQ